MKKSSIYKVVFMYMEKIVSDYKNYKLSTIKTGRPLRIPIEDRVLILLLYFKQYFSMSYVAYQYNTSKSCIYYIISDILKFLKVDMR